MLSDKKYEIKFDEIRRQYQLCRIHLSLFDTNGLMRSNTKSKLGHYLTSDKSFIRTAKAYQLMKNIETEVLFDGGAFLQLVG